MHCRRSTIHSGSRTGVMFEIEFGVTKLPKYDVPEGYTSWEYLQKLCREGLERRYREPTQELKDRLTYELDTIKIWDT